LNDFELKLHERGYGSLQVRTIIHALARWGFATFDRHMITFTELGLRRARSPGSLPGGRKPYRYKYSRIPPGLF